MGVTEQHMPRSMRIWLEIHALLALPAIVISGMLGIVWPAALLMGGSFLAGYLTNKDSWREAGRFGGPANLVTAIRLAMMVVAGIFAGHLGPWPMGILLAVAASLDGLDGEIARRFNASSLFGEYLDKETDSFFVTIGSLILWNQFGLGWWILLPALLRPLYVFTRKWTNTGHLREPKFRYGRVIAVVIMVAIPLSMVLPPVLRFWSLLLSVSTVSASFLKSFLWLFTNHHSAQQSSDMKSTPISKTIWKFLKKYGWLPLTVGLNILCFWPQSIFSLEMIESLPWLLPPEEGMPSWWITRSNADWFRLWGELWILGFLSVLIRPKKTWLAWITAVAVPLFLIFQVYYLASISLYGQQPYLNNDFTLLKEVVPLFLSQVLGDNWSLPIQIGIGSVLGIIVVGGISFVWSRSLRLFPYRSFAIVLWSVVGLGLFWLSFQGYQTDQPQENHTVRWVSYSFAKSTDIPSGTAIEFLPDGINLYKSYFEETLDTRPDVYWIFLESYGKVVAVDPDMQAPYQQLMDSIRDRWQALGWESISQYSNAPVKGGRSWLAFTSALAGFRLENHLVYKDLIERYYNYPHVIRWFKHQEYVTTRVKTMNKQAASTPRNLILADRFYGFDHWFQNDSFPYQGFKYDVFGGIPDQYGLNYAVEKTREYSDDPLFLFMITMSGHQPWFPPAPILEDWHHLDTIRQDPREIELDSAAQKNLYLFYEARLRDSVKSRYLDVIEYELGVVDHFMRTEADSNSIFVLVGDHQPPELGMSWRYNFSTPIHIISRDTAFLAGFSEANFEKGMHAVTYGNQPIQHESMFSLFVTRLLQRYGKGQPNLEWINDGLRVPEEEEP